MERSEQGHENLPKQINLEPTTVQTMHKNITGIQEW